MVRGLRKTRWRRFSFFNCLFWALASDGTRRGASGAYARLSEAPRTGRWVTARLYRCARKKRSRGGGPHATVQKTNGGCSHDRSVSRSAVKRPIGDAFSYIIRHPSQKHQIQWFGAYEKRVGDASAFLTAYFGLWHGTGLAEEHHVHMRDSQRHHAPAVG